MVLQRVRLVSQSIIDWDSFHSVFAEILGFPDFYGRNMNAWIDCLSYLDEEGVGMTSIALGEDERLIVRIPDSSAFKARVPEVFDALVECTAFVNERYVKRGRSPLVGLLLA